MVLYLKFPYWSALLYVQMKKAKFCVCWILLYLQVIAIREDVHEIYWLVLGEGLIDSH